MFEKEPAPRQTVLPEISIGPGALNAAVAAFVEACPAVVVVHDGCLAPACLSRIGELSPSATLLDVRRSQPGALDGLASDTGILYACLRDDLGLPFVDRAYARRLRVQPVWHADPRGYRWRNTPAAHALHEEVDRQRKAGFLKLDHGLGDFVNLIQAFEATRGRPGCIVEVGCFCGSSAGALLSYVRCRQAERGYPDLDFHFMDVFDGFNYPEALESSDACWAGTHATDGFVVVRDRIRACGHDVPGMTIEVHRCNVITDPIPAAITRAGVRLANIDVDLYEAVVAGLARFAPLIVPGGIMICEDAGHTPLLIGALKAVEEFMASDIGRQFCRIDLGSGQTFLIKTHA
jgi:hypothetical protein